MFFQIHVFHFLYTQVKESRGKFIFHCQLRFFQFYGFWVGRKSIWHFAPDLLSFFKGVFVWVWEFWFLDLVIRTKRIADTRTYLFSLRILWIIRDICIMCCCWNLLLAFRSRSWTCTTSPMMKMILVCLLSALSFYPLIFVFSLKYWFLLLRP